MMTRFSLLWVIGIGLLPFVDAQASTTAVCNSAFSWMNNTRGQSPCLVAAFLQGACGTGQWTVPLLPFTSDGQQQAYLPPNSTVANICTCSGAVYNLMSACAACQGGAWLQFAPWALACESADLLSLPSDFPENIPIPDGTTVPTYATTDPRAWSGGSFNVAQARQIALGGPAPTLSQSTSSLASTSSTSSSSTSAVVTPSAQSSRHDDTGAIVGGVVGGILGVALVSLLLVWILCGQKVRKRFSMSARPQEKSDVLGRAFSTPKSPPQLANIVVPVPVRPYPSNGYSSYMSTTTGGSNVVERPHSSSPKESTEHYGSDVGILELGRGPQSPPVTGQDRRSSVARSFLGRITSIRWRRQQSPSMASIGTGTVMTAGTGNDSDAGHSSRNVSRQNTGRRIVNPVPFLLPMAKETEVVDISSGNTTAQPSPPASYPSAADEKRRLNPPAYPGSVPWTSTTGTTTARSQRTDPQNGSASNSLLDLTSGAATIGSEVQMDSLGPPPLPPAATTIAQARTTSLPSNIVLPSPFDILSQDASSGVLDSSPIQRRPAGPVTPLRFTVTNPGRDVEM